MPWTAVNVFRESNGDVPLIKWLAGLKKGPPKAFERALERIQELEDNGYELGMPSAKRLGGGITELRYRIVKVQFRMLYFFENQCAVISHGLDKEGKIPPGDIALAKKRRALVATNFNKHTADLDL